MTAAALFGVTIWALLAAPLAMLPASRWDKPSHKWRAVALAPYVFVRMAYSQLRGSR